MIKKVRVAISKLPEVPKGSEFLVGGKYAKINADNKLELYSNASWYDTGMTLDQYAYYWDKETCEQTLQEYIQHNWGSSHMRKNVYFFFNPSLNKFQSSYNEPVQKGTRLVDGKHLPIMKAGEVLNINSEYYPQIVSLIEMFGNFDLYKFEDQVRESFEFDQMRKGVALPQYDKFGRYYEDRGNKPTHNFNVLLRDYMDKYFYDLLGIELVKE